MSFDSPIPGNADISRQGTPIVVNIRALVLTSISSEMRWMRWRARLSRIGRKGRSNVPCQTEMSADALPLREDLLSYLDSERESGRSLYLLSEPGNPFTQSLAERLQAKILDAEVSLPLREGDGIRPDLPPDLVAQGYNYVAEFKAGDSWWSGARSHTRIIRDGSSQSSGAADLPAGERQFFTSGFHPLALIKALRPHQWTKNLLVFVPLTTAHRWTDHAAVTASLLAFACFSLLASTIYLANDLLDLPADRLHPYKKNRPLASGRISIPTGLGLLVMTLAIGGVILAFLPVEASICAGAYILATIAYSVHLKTFLALDVVMLAFFYTIRLLFGGAAAGIEISIWTLAFSLFIFLSLALAKRASELDTSSVEFSGGGGRRPYRASDRPALISQAGSSAYTALLVLGLYIHSPEVHEVYRHPKILWLAIPAFVYWLSRFLLVVQRGELHCDPVAFAIRDPASWVVLCYLLALVWLAS